MRASFIKLLLEEKKEGRTVFFSSHVFEELEDTCDYVGLIKDGHLLQVVDMQELKNNDDRYYAVGFENDEEMNSFSLLDSRIAFKYEKDKYLVVVVKQKNISALIKKLGEYHITFLRPIAYTLQNRFEELIVNKKEIVV